MSPTTPTSPISATATTITASAPPLPRPGSGHRKREREIEDDETSPETVSPTAHSTGVKPESPAVATAAATSTSNFRNVSACNRCRSRKNRCDQRLPACSGCLKANIKCVGFDPVSKREIPRSYVYYLETRLGMLEELCRESGVAVPAPEEDFSISEDVVNGRRAVPFPPQLDEHEGSKGGDRAARDSAAKVKAETAKNQNNLDPALRNHDDHEKLNKLVSSVGMVSVQGASDSRYLGSTSGISFARVVFAAVKSSVSQSPSEKGGMPQHPKLKPVPSDAAGGGTTMRDSFFGLHTRPTIKSAPFPEKDIGLRLVDLYFEYANAQIPTLHRPEFMAMFERVYNTEANKRTSRELYMLNIVFAIGSGIINDSSANLEQKSSNRAMGADSGSDGARPNSKRQRMSSSQQHQPEEYHSSAIVHLESFLGSSPAAEGFGGGLEELQAVLLLAGLALLRPVAPGLWYIIGVAVRLGVDLGLHSEEADPDLDAPSSRVRSDSEGPGPPSLGRKQWTRDLRRRLWWCVYSFDRLVSTCVGRPFGITDQVVTTEFPSLLDDSRITRDGLFDKPADRAIPSYKLVSHHYFRLRLLQSEILQVLQYRQAQQARSTGTNRENRFMHTDIPSPFLTRFHSFREWRTDVDQRLLEWKDSAPRQHDTGVAFTPLFLDLNYWQAVIMLYRQSLSVPESLAGELSASTGEDLSPSGVSFDEKEDEQMVFLKVAQAGQTVLKIYRQLHRLKLVNYTFLATHHLFMSGISFLYAIWHSTLVRSQLTLDDVDFTILAATSVLSDLIDKCPPAEACRDAFVRMSKATISMCMSTTGFGAASSLGTQPLNSPQGYFGRSDSFQDASAAKLRSSTTSPPVHRKPIPRFDMDFKDLFTEDELGQQRRLSHHATRGGAGQPASIDTAMLDASSGSSAQHTTDSTPASFPPLDRQSSTASTSTSHQTYQPQLQPTQQTQISHFATGAHLPNSQHRHSPTTFNPNLSNQPQQQQQQQQPDFTFQDLDLDFLDTFPATEPSQDFWMGGNGGELLDLGFGTGGSAGAGWDEAGTGDWDFTGSGGGGAGGTGGGGTIDLYDGFYFGHGGGSGGGGF